MIDLGLLHLLDGTSASANTYAAPALGADLLQFESSDDDGEADHGVSKNARELDLRLPEIRGQRFLFNRAPSTVTRSGRTADGDRDAAADRLSAATDSATVRIATAKTDASNTADDTPATTKPSLDKAVGASHAAARHSAKPTAGRGWFNMPAAELTDELKRDLRLIQMRSVLDRKKFYKKDSALLKLDDGRPKFVQVGTVMDAAADFYQRVPKRDRKQRIVDELLADSEKRAYFKRKFNEQFQRTQENAMKNRVKRAPKRK